MAPNKKDQFNVGPMRSSHALKSAPETLCVEGIQMGVRTFAYAEFMTACAFVRADA